jgi:uncharacterized membrane protein (UPF0182 family)
VAVPAPSLRRPRLLAALLVLVVIVVLVLIGSSLYTQLLFFREIHFTGVFGRVLGVRVALYLLAGAAVSAVVGANVVLAYLLRPAYRPTSPEQRALDRYRAVLWPRTRLVLLLVGGLVFLIAGSSAQTRWGTWLTFVHRTSFGVRDPQFHRDVSFYAFTYPFIRMLLSYAFAAVIVSLFAAAAVHYLTGAIRVQAPGDHVEHAARGHLSALFALFVLLKAIAYYYDRYGLVFSGRGAVTGASYTDVHVVLPAKSVLLIISLFCALLFGVGVRQRSWVLPGIAFALLLASALIIDTIVPAVIERFIVRPNAITKEQPYIQRNINATLQSYALDPSKLQVIDASGVGSTTALATDTGAQAAARLLDPNVLSSTYQQLQQQRAYFGFPPSLDIDRYRINGTLSDQVVAVREVDLNGLAANQRNWINTHLVFTHGNGFVAAPANQVDPAGKPVFDVQDIPPRGPNGTASPIPIDEPRIYFGEQSPDYSIVHTRQQEVDGPGGGNNSAAGANDSTSSYVGSGGVGIGSLARRAAFALSFKDLNLLISGELTSQSKILYNRAPATRVQKAAPWLTLDSDPYPAVVDGRIQWIVDGYTTSDGFPYSERTSLTDVTADALTATPGRQAAPAEQVNYVRNSVKATVDAYTGKVTLYAFDPSDPVLRTWMKAFPGTVQPDSAISPDLRAHFRYPEDVFKVQRGLLSRYHVTNAQAFYRGQDQWDVPQDPSSGTGAKQPPYYLLTQVPGQPAPSFDLTSTYNPTGRPNLAAYVSVSGEQADYGSVRIIRLPANTEVQGVGQIEAGWQGDPVIAKDISLYDQKGSQVQYGNLLTIPAGGGLLYVQPLYVSASAGERFPHVQKVLVSYNGRTGYCPTLGQSLATVLSPSPLPVDACPAPGTPTTATPVPTGSPSPGTTTPPGATPTTGANTAAVQAAVKAANDAFAAAQQDFSSGNFTDYATQLGKLRDALNQLQTLAPGLSPAAAVSASPSAAPTP